MSELCKNFTELHNTCENETTHLCIVKMISPKKTNNDEN